MAALTIAKKKGRKNSPIKKKLPDTQNDANYTSFGKLVLERTAAVAVDNSCHVVSNEGILGGVIDQFWIVLGLSNSIFQTHHSNSILFCVLLKAPPGKF